MIGAGARHLTKHDPAGPLLLRRPRKARVLFPLQQGAQIDLGIAAIIVLFQWERGLDLLVGVADCILLVRRLVRISQ